MPITLNDAIRRLRARLNEPAYPTLSGSTVGNPPPRFYTDTELTDWINDGLRDVSRRAETLITYDTTVSIPAYTQNSANPIPVYALPTDIIRIHRVEFQVAGDSSQVYPLEGTSQGYLDNLWQKNEISTSSYPEFWVTRGYVGGTGRNAFSIQLYPQPSQAGVLNIFYYRLPIRLGDPVATPANYNLTLDCVEGWDDMVLDYAFAQALIKRNDSGFAQILQIYETKMANIVDVTRSATDQPSFMQYDSMLLPWGDGW